jgi:hypothetical protein
MKTNRASQKGETRINALVIVIVIILIIVGIKYHDDHRDDIVIHPPHIDVH